MIQSFINPILSIAFLSFVVLFCCGQSSRTPTSNNSDSTSTPVTENAKGEITISVGDLYNEYKADKAAADNKYKGKTLVVTGNYKQLSVSRSILLISDKKDVLGVQCLFKDDQQNRVKSLSDGQTITVKGVCYGRVGNILLQDCSIQ